MTTQIELLWQDIRRQENSASLREGECRLVKISGSHACEIFAGLEGTGSVILAFGVAYKPAVIDFETGSLDYFRQQRAGGNWLMVLRLNTAGLEQVFGRLCQDLIDECATVPTEAGLIVLFRERLVLWKKLFQQANVGLLEKYQIKGLVAELLALSELTDDMSDNPCAALAAWTGPSGGDQDFLFATKAIEVKGVGPFIESVGIASACQLDAVVPLELHIYVLIDSTLDATDPLTLPIIISRLELVFSKYPNALKAFREKLLEAGYVEHVYYQTVIYSLVGVNRYLVSGAFPRLIQSMLPTGVSNVSYSVSLASIVSFQLPDIQNAD